MTSREVVAIARLFPLLLVAAPMVGCTSARTVSRSDAEALAWLTENLGGKTVEVVHGAVRERGSRLRVHADSTRWLAENTSRSVPTASVRAFVIDPRWANVKLWAGVGAATFGLVSALTCDDDIFTEEFCVYLVPARRMKCVDYLMSTPPNANPSIRPRD